MGQRGEKKSRRRRRTEEEENKRKEDRTKKKWFKTKQKRANSKRALRFTVRNLNTIANPPSLT